MGVFLRWRNGVLLWCKMLRRPQTLLMPCRRRKENRRSKRWGNGSHLLLRARFSQERNIGTKFHQSWPPGSKIRAPETHRATILTGKYTKQARTTTKIVFLSIFSTLIRLYFELRASNWWWWAAAFFIGIKFVLIRHSPVNGGISRNVGWLFVLGRSTKYLYIAVTYSVLQQESVVTGN